MSEPVPVVKKSGRMSNEDKDFIRRNIKDLGLEEVARQVNKTVDAVQEFLNKEGIFIESEGADLESIQTAIEKQFKTTMEYDSLKAEFDDDELKYFVYKYAKFYAQFKSDVMPTEQTQIMQLVKFEILMRRNLRDTKSAKSSILRMENELIKLYAKYENEDMPNDAKALALNFENQLLSAKSSQQAKSSEFVKLQDKHSSLMKELKGTRDQRISKFESSAKDIVGLLKDMQTTKFRALEGRQQALVQLAIQKEKARLGELHQYEDKMVDRPILSVDTVTEDD